ncbi:MAG: hypothetical protein ABT20_10410 [Rubrivivax sp. SCN 70-15]|nr:MAG: hypothetical protein ABT20_10410 [Rubrivivax sp. SCN 70-15]
MRDGQRLAAFDPNRAPDSQLQFQVQIADEASSRSTRSGVHRIVRAPREMAASRNLARHTETEYTLPVNPSDPIDRPG